VEHGDAGGHFVELALDKGFPDIQNPPAEPFMIGKTALQGAVDEKPKFRGHNT
jgi:hypothetical protein